MDNVFIERLWRSLKYECVYLSAAVDENLSKGWGPPLSEYAESSRRIQPVVVEYKATRSVLPLGTSSLLTSVKHDLTLSRHVMRVSKSTR